MNLIAFSRRVLPVAALAGCLTLAACGSPGGATGTAAPISKATETFAAKHFTTKLAGVCPNPLIVQTNWLPEPDHGALYELIGPGGTMKQYSYSGPLGSTGITFRILSGGPGDSNLDVPTTLYAGNPVARVTPQLGMDSPDTALQDYKAHPVVGVVSLQEHDPLSLLYNPAKFHHLNSVAAIRSAVKHGAKLYVTNMETPFVPFLIGKGVPSSGFIGGYTGDLDKFVTSSGTIINQGYADSEVVNLEHYTKDWDKPVAYTLIWKLGFNDYDDAIEVAKPKLAKMAPCLKKLVPMIQQAQVDYIEHPGPVNQVLATFNSKGYGASYWKTPVGYSKAADRILVADDIVGNADGGKGPLGAFSMSRMKQVAKILLPIFKREGVSEPAGVKGADVVTNRFIDPHIKLPVGK